MDNATSQIPIPFHESSGEPIPDLLPSHGPGYEKAWNRRPSLRVCLCHRMANRSRTMFFARRCLAFRRRFSARRKNRFRGRLGCLWCRGYRPTQAHLDVWEQCLDLAAKHGTGKQIRFSAYSFLKAIGRNTGKSDYEWLKEAINDLTSCLGRILTDATRTSVP